MGTKNRDTGEKNPDRNAKTYPHKQRAEIGMLGSRGQNFQTSKAVKNESRLSSVKMSPQTPHSFLRTKQKNTTTQKQQQKSITVTRFYRPKG